MKTENIEDFRKKLRMNQTQYANLMNLASKSIQTTLNTPNTLPTAGNGSYKAITISRMENKPDIMSGIDWLTLQNALGLTDEQLLALIRGSFGLEKMERTFPVQQLKIGNVQGKRDEFHKKVDTLADRDLPENISKLVKEKTKIMLEKPRIAFVGASNSGKTTMIASLLGYEEDGHWLPTSWKRETDAVCFIRDIHSRPQECGSSRVLAFNSYTDMEKYTEQNTEGVKPIEAGGYELLEKYASFSKRQVLEADSNADVEVKGLLIYADAPILANCDLIDMPGYHATIPSDIQGLTEEEEAYDNRAFEIVQQISWGTGKIHVDAVFFAAMMEKSDFCRTEADMEVLIRLFRQLSISDTTAFPPDFYIVASHARNALEPGITDGKIPLRAACERIWGMLSHSNKCEVDTIEDFQEIFLTFDVQDEELSKKFYDTVKEFLEDDSCDSIQASRKYLKNDMARVCESIDNEILKVEKLQGKKKEREEVHISDYQDTFEKTYSMQKKDLQKKVQMIYGGTINKESIVRVINEKKFKKNRDDVAKLNSYLKAELTHKVSTEIKQCNEALIETVVKMFPESETVLKPISTDEETCNGVEKKAVKEKETSLIKLAKTATAASGAAIAGIESLSSVAATIGTAGAATATVTGLLVAASFGLPLLAIAGVAGFESGMLSALGSAWKSQLADKVCQAYEQEKLKESLMKSAIESIKAESNICKKTIEECYNQRKLQMEDIDKFVAQLKCNRVACSKFGEDLSELQ